MVMSGAGCGLVEDPTRLMCCCHTFSLIVSTLSRVIWSWCQVLGAGWSSSSDLSDPELYTTWKYKPARSGDGTVRGGDTTGGRRGRGIS
jgi:hypothetical protein